MKIEERRKRKPRVVWDRAANWQTVSGMRSNIGSEPILEVGFFGLTDDATGKQIESGFRLSGTRSDFEHLQAVVHRLLEVK